MSEDGAARRKRLKALKEKAGKGVKFRNYRPQDAAIKQQVAGSSDDADRRDGRKRRKGVDEGQGQGQEGEEEEEEEEKKRRRAPADNLIQQELKKQKETQDEEELNIAPKKVNWDLKRDVEKKLDKLNRRTQRAIVEIIRERMAEEAANESSSSEEEEDDDDEDGSESESSSDDED